MAGDDTLASVGGKVTDVFVSAFASGNSNVSLVFLPFALPAPDDIVQAGVVNPTKLASFLVPNFDAPYLMSASQYSVHGKDLYYGSASQIYGLAVTSARPTAAAGTDAWKRVNAEIAMAQSALNPAGIATEMASVPDDWILPDNSSYWSTFDSNQSQGGPGTPATSVTGSGGGPPPRVVDPVLWTIKPAAEQAAPVHSLIYLHALAPASPLVARPIIETARVALSPEVAREPLQIDRSELPLRATTREFGVSNVWRPSPILHRPWPLPSPPPPPAPAPPPSSSMSVHFEYMSATIGFTAAGVSIWNGTFLADAGWCVPGMAKGGLLPAPDAAAAQGQGPLVYGLPVAIILVRNLTISVKWAGQEQASLGDAGFLGPFSLAGASAANAPDGSWTYARPGIQVVALLCSHLPMLPPADAPDVAQAGTTAASGTAAGAAPASVAGSTQAPPSDSASGAPQPSNASQAAAVAS